MIPCLLPWATMIPSHVALANTAFVRNDQGPVVHKLMTSLVNEALKFQTLKYLRYASTSY